MSAARCAGLCLLVGLMPSPARAVVLHEDPLDERSVELGVMVRTFSFLLAGPLLDAPYNTSDMDPTGQGLADVRLSFAYRGPRLKVVLHNQVTGRVQAHAAAGPLALGRGLEPRRLLPLQADLAGDAATTVRVREAMDWAYVALMLGPVTVTAGRQPITLGRGRIFVPTDLVCTFALTEVDTEFKPGADAVRIDWTIARATALTAVAAGGKHGGDPSLAGSAFALRLSQGFGGTSDGATSGEAALLAGLIRNDVVIGLDGALDPGPLDLYAEITVTLPTAASLTPNAEEETGLFAVRTDAAVVRAVAGATLKPHGKVTLSPELHYNGFGAWDRGEYLGVALSERVAVGEMSLLGRLYLGAACVVEAHPLLQVTALGVFNLRDPSGLVSLGARYNVAPSVDLVAGAYLPLGRVPDISTLVPVPRSEFGLYPYFFFLEMRAAM